MNNNQKIPSETELLERAQSFFEEKFMKNQKAAFKKLSLDKIKYNPFLIRELASRISDTIDANSVAKALVYPRVLGTSANTAFGSNTQNMIVEIMGQDVVSNVSGMDIEYHSPVTGDYRWAQLKAGPNTINKNDIAPMENDFQKAQNLAKQNRNTRFTFNSPVCAILYGEHDQVSSVYKTMESNGKINILVGEEFWYDLTGYKDFYQQLIKSIKQASQSISLKPTIDEAVTRIEKEILSQKQNFGL
ncbi:PmeII family type II restriction endonuclease [Leuconostoc mesenteroides]|uniref:PmeII family type II restriction endonuclease n=1 Tax=Leuconostoc mesenteroides TaxID=1245 RepID=UPI0025A1D063|nr:PmeII family type II restriction endonuclease [Leuconostoc mesenteroides]MDM7540008.1 PmeII family type II restriction endonuclease [Leuconostoc mesenteroides]